MFKIGEKVIVNNKAENKKLIGNAFIFLGYLRDSRKIGNINVRFMQNTVCKRTKRSISILFKHRTGNAQHLLVIGRVSVDPVQEPHECVAGSIIIPGSGGSKEEFVIRIVSCDWF